MWLKWRGGRRDGMSLFYVVIPDVFDIVINQHARLVRCTEDSGGAGGRAGWLTDGRALTCVCEPRRRGGGPPRVALVRARPEGSPKADVKLELYPRKPWQKAAVLTPSGRHSVPLRATRHPAVRPPSSGIHPSSVSALSAWMINLLHPSFPSFAICFVLQPRLLVLLC